jgi:hypothetical protein
MSVQPAARSPRPLSFIAKLGLVLFTVAIVMLHFLNTDIDPVTRGISHYVFGKFGWLLAAGFVSLGIGSAALILLLWRGPITIPGRIGLLLLVLWTALIEAGSFFSMDPPGGVRTVSGRIHSLAGLGFLLLPAAALLIEWSRSRTHSVRRDRVIGLIFVCSVFVASGLLITFNGFLLNVGIGGAVQRAYWLVIIVWLFFLAQRMTAI